MNSHPNRRAMLAFGATSLGWLPGLSAARADGFRVLCGYPPGGSVDIVCRKLADKIAQRTGGIALVENKQGAAGRVAVLELKRTPADGRHLLVTPASIMTMYPHVYTRLGYDVFSDFQPVCTVAATAFALAVGPKVPASVPDFPSFLDWARSHRASAQIGNAGAGSMPHFVAMLIARESRVEFDHVPYRGGVVSMQAAAAGEIAASLATESAARALQQSGKLRVLATTGTERAAFFPQVPTFAELGHSSLTQREWFGVFAPSGTAAAQTSAISEMLRAILAEPDVRDTWERIGLQVDALGPPQLKTALRREHDFWGPLIRSSGFRPES